MMTQRDLNSTGSPPMIERVLPSDATAVAWALLVVVACLGIANDGCAGYADQSTLVHLVVVALCVQVVALVLAFVRFGRRLPGAGLRLLGTCIAAVLALPAAGIVYVIVDPLFCGSILF